MSVLGTVVGARSQLPFSPAPGPSRSPHTGAPSCFHPVLAFTALPGLMQLDQATAWLGLPRSVREWACVAAILPPRHRNINRFPFRPTRLRSALGPAYSRLTTHCRETLAPTVAGILTPLCCYYHRDLHWRPVQWTSRPTFYPPATPPYHHQAVSLVIRGFGGPLRPVNFRGLQPRRVSCYALLRG